MLSDIAPRTIDLTPFDTVWLGSPVWLYSPAPPIWAFVEHKHVLRGRMTQQITPEQMLQAIDDEWLGSQAKP